jgi:hypothetical protein
MEIIAVDLQTQGWVNMLGDPWPWVSTDWPMGLWRFGFSVFSFPL